MNSDDFKTLERLWYAKLKESGFVEIENTELASRPLLEWHSFKFLSKSAQVDRSDAQAYAMKADAFLNSNHIDEICTIISSARNVTYSAEMAKLVWKSHCEGVSERKIATDFKLTQTQVHNILKRFRQWMNLVLE